jgi:hypothetical protein
MAEKLNWFKFDPANWMMGRISRQPEKVQLAYLRLCCVYWNKRCEMTIEDASLEIMDEYEILIKFKFIKTEKKNIRISWLDEQLKGIEAKSVTAANAADARWNKRNANAMQTDANALHLQDSALQNDAEKKRTEKKRKDEIIPIDEIADEGFENWDDVPVVPKDYKPIGEKINDEFMLAYKYWQDSTIKDTKYLSECSIHYKVNVQDVVNTILLFGRHLIVTGKTHQSLRKWKDHFSAYLNKKILAGEVKTKFIPIKSTGE